MADAIDRSRNTKARRADAWATRSESACVSNIGTDGSIRRMADRTAPATAPGSPEVRTTTARSRGIQRRSLAGGKSGQYTIASTGPSSEVSRTSPATPTTVYHGPPARMRRRWPIADWPGQDRAAKAWLTTVSRRTWGGSGCLKLSPLTIGIPMAPKYAGATYVTG